MRLLRLASSWGPRTNADHPETIATIATLCLLGVIGCEPGAADSPVADTAPSAPTDDSPGRLSPGFHPSADGQYVAQTGFTSATAGPEGLWVGTGEGALRISIAAWGRGDNRIDLVPVTPVRAQRHGQDDAPSTRLEWHHPSLTEHWSTHRQGVEHGWDVHTPPPAGHGPLVFELALTGGSLRSIDADGHAVSITAGQDDVRHYTALKAWDANRVALDARFARSNQALVVVVDDRAATYPLTIDPLLTTGETILTASNAGADAQFGYDVAIIGDVNADGYDDAAVGAPYDSDLANSAGAVYIYLGSASGLDPSTELILHASDGAENDYFGFSVAGAGDVNGDGYDDLIVGAPRADTPDLSNVGAVYVYLGGAGGIDAGSEDVQTLSDWQAKSYGGYSVAGAGDVNGDGYADVVVGAPGSTSAVYGGVDDPGMATCHLGSAGGVDWATTYLSQTGELAYREPIEYGGYGDLHDSMGYAVAGAGDLDGDGIDDIAVGAPNGGEITVSFYYPDPHLLTMHSGSGWDESDPPPDSRMNELYKASFAQAIAAAGDVDGDGYGDLLVGMPTHETSYSPGIGGLVALYPGGSGGVSSSTAVLFYDAAGSYWDYYGRGVAGNGDVDGDGYADVVVGAPGKGDFGGAWLLRGSAAGLDQNDQIDLSPAAPVAGGWFGSAVSIGGDVNGDGYDDIIVGRSADDSVATDAGSVVVLAGTCQRAWYVDEDGDGYGSPAIAARYDCEAMPGEVSNSDDCDDNDAALSPDAAEQCDDIDHDCDGTVDNDVTMYDWYRDNDGDGYPADGDTESACGPTGEYDTRYVDRYDCDDTDASIHPGAEEVCNHVDDDCDDETDEEFILWCADRDNDGHGDPTVPMDCASTQGYTALCDDCDDDDPTILPGALELCDGVDQDCNGIADLSDGPGPLTWHSDEDGDGYSIPHANFRDCLPLDSVPRSAREDCDDTDRNIHPGATERPGDGIDQDCDGATEDVDATASCGGCVTGHGEKSGWPLIGIALGLVGAAMRRRG